MQQRSCTGQPFDVLSESFLTNKIYLDILDKTNSWRLTTVTKKSYDPSCSLGFYEQINGTTDTEHKQTRTSPRHTRATTHVTRSTNTTTSKGTNKTSSPNKRARLSSPKRNTITIKKVLLTSSSGSTISNQIIALGRMLTTDDQLDIELESDLDVQSGPEVGEDDSELGHGETPQVTLSLMGMTLEYPILIK